MFIFIFLLVLFVQAGEFDFFRHFVYHNRVGNSNSIFYNMQDKDSSLNAKLTLTTAYKTMEYIDTAPYSVSGIAGTHFLSMKDLGILPIGDEKNLSLCRGDKCDNNGAFYELSELDGKVGANETNLLPNVFFKDSIFNANGNLKIGINRTFPITLTSGLNNNSYNLHVFTLNDEYIEIFSGYNTVRIIKEQPSIKDFATLLLEAKSLIIDPRIIELNTETKTKIDKDHFFTAELGLDWDKKNYDTDYSKSFYDSFRKTLLIDSSLKLITHFTVVDHMYHFYSGNKTYSESLLSGTNEYHFEDAIGIAGYEHDIFDNFYAHIFYLVPSDTKLNEPLKYDLNDEVIGSNSYEKMREVFSKLESVIIYSDIDDFTKLNIDDYAKHIAKVKMRYRLYDYNYYTLQERVLYERNDGIIKPPLRKEIRASEDIKDADIEVNTWR